MVHRPYVLFTLDTIILWSKLADIWDSAYLNLPNSAVGLQILYHFFSNSICKAMTYGGIKTLSTFL